MSPASTRGGGDRRCGGRHPSIMLGYIALQTWRPGMLAPAIAFTAAGLVAGSEGFGWIEVSPDGGSLRLLAETTLAFVLFADASRIDLRALRDGYGVPARLLGIGLPLTLVAGTAAALAVLPHLGAGGGGGAERRRSGHRRGARAGGGDR